MKNIFVIGLVIGASMITNGAIAHTSNVSIQDHYKTVIDRTPYEVEVCTTVDTNKGPTIGGLDVQGAIIGGIIGNQIGDMKGNGAAGALIGGLLGGEKTPTNKCVIETRYNETSKNVYSHSTVTFSANGRDYSLRFIK